MNDDDQIVMKAEFDERQARALSFAIDFTLEKWVGQGDMDQEMLMHMRTAFHGMILEFNLSRDMTS